MKIFKKISISLILFTFFFMNPIKVFAATTTADSYVNTVYALMLCESGSSLTDCSNPVILNETPNGTDMDIASVDAGASAGQYGNLSVIPKGTTYTHGQVVLDRIFTVKGTSGSCSTGGTAGTTAAWGVGTTGTAASQVIWAGDLTGGSTSMNSSSHKDETATGDSTDGELDNGDQYMKFRWALASAYTYDGVKVPKMTISFDLSAALTFNGTCGGTAGPASGDGIYMSAPIITNIIE